MTTSPIRDKRQLREFAAYWKRRKNLRNYALIVLGVCTMLRIGDLLRLCWDDVYDKDDGRFLSHITLTEQKTGKIRVIALNAQAMRALEALYPHRRGDFIFAGNRKDMRPISRVQAWRIIKMAALAARVDGIISCHSLRKTAGYHMWKQGALPVLLMDLYNHSSFEVTKRYLGITQEERDAAYLGLALF